MSSRMACHRGSKARVDLDNIAIARLLSETADLMEIAEEDGFRIRSYRNAAGVIEGYPEQVTAILGDPSRKLTEITGIGKGIAAVIGEVVARGSFERRDELLKRYPPTALEMLRIPGLGPKTIRALWDHFRVSTLEELEQLCWITGCRSGRAWGPSTKRRS